MLWVVTGADRDTGDERTLHIQASSEASARRGAETKGNLYVADIQPAEQPGTAPLDELAAAVDGREPTAPPPRASLLDGFIGSAVETTHAEAMELIGGYLAEGERIVRVYKIIRDLFIFTDKRLILIDKQGLTGKHQEWMFVPYKNIIRYSLETASLTEPRSTLRLWLSGSPEPIIRHFTRDDAVRDICKMLGKLTTK